MSNQAPLKNGELLRMININSVTLPFFWVKASNVVIIAIALNVPFSLLATLLKGEVDTASLIFLLLFLPFLGFAAWIAWKNVTVLNAVIQPWTLTSLFLLGTFSLIIVLLQIVFNFVGGGIDTLNEIDAKSLFAGTLVFGYMGLLATGSAISVLWLRHRKIEALNMKLTDFIRSINQPTIKSEKRFLPPKNRTKGWWLIIGGSVVMLGIQFVPDSIYYSSSGSVRTISQVGSLAFIMFLYARSQFQPSAEKLLEIDKRSPVLFLRSFRDDEEYKNYLNADSSFVDYSLESRIADHFFQSGPFIAVGAPKGQHIAIGAARATLADAEWQGKVVEWMDSALLIVVLAGITSWIEWELKKVIERGHAHKLILCFPQSKPNWFAKDKRFRTLKTEVNARFEAVKAAFVGTQWEASLCQLVDPLRIRSIIFEENGRVTAVTARSRNRNTYHLAVLIGHFLILQGHKPA